MSCTAETAADPRQGIGMFIRHYAKFDFLAAPEIRKRAPAKPGAAPSRFARRPLLAIAEALLKCVWGDVTWMGAASRAGDRG